MSTTYDGKSRYLCRPQSIAMRKLIKKKERRKIKVQWVRVRVNSEVIGRG